MSDPRPHLFHAVLYPHRSLSRQGFWILMGAIILIMGFAASRALSIGAWPVAVFALADIALVYGAFKLSYRAGRQFEEVTVDEAEIRVRKVTPSGHVSTHAFQTAWAKLSITRHEDEGVTRLDLGSHGQWIVLGAFLDPEARENFADAFSTALNRAKAQPIT